MFRCSLGPLAVASASMLAVGGAAAQSGPEVRREGAGAPAVGVPVWTASDSAQADGNEEPTWRLFGDYRLRGEMDRDRRSAPGRERIRLRLRLGAEVGLMPGLAVGARLSTEPDPDVPNSPYVDLGDGFRRARFAFDRLYLRWKPSIREERPLTLWVGKFPNPLLQPSDYGELVWDADVHPEGLAAVFEPLPGLRLAAGGFQLLARGDASDVNMGAAQAAIRIAPAAGVTLDAAVGGYFYGDIDASAAVELAAGNRGNALLRDPAGDVIGFASSFDVWQAHGSLIYEGLGAPIGVAAEYFANASAAPGEDDDGFAVSARAGALDDAGTAMIEYRYQDVGRESVFSSLAQDDFLDATGFEGHIVGIGWRFLAFARVRAWTLWSRRPDEGTFQKRYRLDLDFSWSLPSL